MSNYASILGIRSAFPSQSVSNDDLAKDFQGWSGDKIYQKLGIRQRYIAGDDECASDIGVVAANKLFDDGICKPSEIEFLLFCTQSPDYFLPTTACLMQDRLGLPKSCGALDYNLGCSGFVYGLSLAKGLIESGTVRNVLLVTAETYSKFLSPTDQSTRTVFGDGAAATFICGVESNVSRIGPFVLGTNGEGKDRLIVRNGGLREGGSLKEMYLSMDGPEIFNFTLREIPACLQTLFQRGNVSVDTVRYFIFHQANKYMLESLRTKLGIPNEKFCFDMEDCGNTVSATIPIALERSVDKGIVTSGDQIALVGFGVGYSWAAAMLRWGPN